MNREIKFRGLRNYGKGWVYGLPFYSHATGVWSITGSNGWLPTYQNPDEGESTEYHHVDGNTISQYIGVKDRNGKEIYDGDIVLYESEKCVVRFGLKEGVISAFPLSESAHFVCSWGWCEMEVIGNIHENHELL